MRNKAILIVSFGTSHLDALEKTIYTLQKDVADAFSEYKIYSAFTSGIIIKKLAAAGVNILNTEQALKAAIDNGVKELIVQPSLIIEGDEYEKLCSTAEKYANSFEKLSIGKPLLSAKSDYSAVVDIIASHFTEQIAEGLVLMGHGSENAADVSYNRLQEMFIEQGYKNAIVGTVEGRLDIKSVMDKISANGIVNATVAPLMLVAGDHAKNDMAGGEHSWQTVMAKAGVNVSAVLKGLGEIKEIRNIYIEHIRSAIN